MRKLGQRGHDLVTKLKDLPIVDSESDFPRLGDPEKVAQQWASEAGSEKDANLRRMVECLEKAVHA